MTSSTKKKTSWISESKHILWSRWGVVLAFLGLLVPLAVVAAGGTSVDSDGDGFLEFVSDTVIDPIEMNKNFDQVANHIGAYEGAIYVGEETGNVGLGTKEPESALHVYRSGGNIWQTIESGVDSAAAMHLKDSEQEYRIGLDSGSMDNKFAILDATTAQYRLVIGQNGNVGIGATDPMGALTIEPGSDNYPQQFNVSGWSPNGNVDDVYLGVNTVADVESGYPARVDKDHSGWSVAFRTSKVGYGDQGSSWSLGYYRADGSTLHPFNVNLDETSEATVSLDGSAKITTLAGTGVAYVCVDADGVLFRSAGPCN